MNIISILYDFFAGPCLFITVPLCFAGLARKTMIIMSGLDRGLRFPARQTQGYMAGWIEGGGSIVPAMTLASRDMVLAVATTLFHFALIAAPLTARAHGILLDQAWQVFPPRIDPVITGACTMTAIISGLLLLLRRTFVRRVFAVSSWKDFAAMICVLTPFVTGLLAREMIGNYEIVMLIHCAGAHVLLLAIGWTRLGHMVFFTAGRFVASNLYRKIRA